MTNAFERLGMRWKEKSLTIVAGPFTEDKPEDVVEIVSNSGKRWDWRVVEGMEALGTWLDNRGYSEAREEGFVDRSQTAGQEGY